MATCDTWMRPGSPVLSIREAVLTVSESQREGSAGCRSIGLIAVRRKG